jgi:hypothetical protein
MNKDFLEFWGNILLQAAKGQRKLEEAEKWARLGFEAMETQRAFWSAFSGTDNGMGKKPGALDVWGKSAEEFSNICRKWARFFGMVPLEEYEELFRQKEALEKKLAEQRKADPKARWTGKRIMSVQRQMQTELQELTRKQGEQFSELMESIRTFYGQDRSSR